MIDYIDYKSCEGVNGVKFGASSEEIIAAFGEPDETWKHNDGHTVLSYYNKNDFSIHLDDNEKFEFFEVGIRTALSIYINNIKIGWLFKDIVSIICESKNVLESSLGYLTLLDLCVGFTDFFEGDEWDSEKTIAFAKKGYFEQSTQNDQPFVFEKENPCK